MTEAEALEMFYIFIIVLLKMYIFKAVRTAVYTVKDALEPE